MRVTLIAVGRIRPPYRDDVEHYLQMLTRYCHIDHIEVKNDQEIERRIPDRSQIVLLDREGSTYSSEQLADWFEDKRQTATDLCFIIGGPHGSAIKTANHRISFGSFTLPHQLARVVLLEQIYRAHKIIAGEPYHY